MQLIASAYVCLVSTTWAGTQCSTYMKATALQALHSVVLMTVISFLLFATWLQCNVVLLKCFDVQGASFGQWRLPWGAVERHDSIAVLDWIIGQPWCNGKVLLIAFYSPPFSPPPPPPPTRSRYKFSIQLCIRLLPSSGGLFACGASVT